MQIDGSARIFMEKRPITICGPQSASQEYNYRTIYSILNWNQRMSKLGVMAHNTLVQYHPFFDFDISNPRVDVDDAEWQEDVDLIKRELYKIFRREPTIYKRVENGGIHVSFPKLRMNIDHLRRVYSVVNDLIGFRLKVLVLDVGISAFPVPLRSKDNVTFYKDENGNVEVFPIASGDDDYAHTSIEPQRLESATAWLSPDLLDEVFNSLSQLHKIVAGIIEYTGGWFGMVQVLQHLVWYPDSFMPSVYEFLSITCPNTFETEFHELATILKWPRVNMHQPRNVRLSDLLTSLAIRMFRMPDPGIGYSTIVDEIAKLSFTINGHISRMIERDIRNASGEYVKHDVNDVVPRKLLEDVVENLIVFYTESRGAIKLFTGVDWALVNRDAIIRLLTKMNLDWAKVMPNISGKYCQLSIIKPNSNFVYLANGGYFTNGTISQFIDPLDAPANARVSISFEMLKYASSENFANIIEHILSDDALNGECMCECCTAIESQLSTAVNAARYVHTLMCCRGNLTRYVIQLFARMCFKIERKNIIVLIGETADNGKTEFVHILHTVYGDYLRSLAQSTSMSARREMASDVHFAESASLCAIDDALAKSEGDDGSAAMNATALKSLTGGGLNFTRGLYDASDGQREFNMNLLFTGNTLMTVPEDRGIYNRLKNIPFNARFIGATTEHAAEYNEYINETWRTKTLRMRNEFARDGGAFDAGYKLDRAHIGRGLATIFSAYAMHKNMPLESRPEEVHKRYHNVISAPRRKRARIDDDFE